MRVWRAVAAMALAGVGTAARADLPMPDGYYAAVEPGGTVEIHVAVSSGSRGGPDDGLLRRNTATDDIVELTTCSDEHTFLDQCVPAGEYQYGLAKPLACQVSGTEYYGVATVTVGAAAGCTRTIDAPIAASSVPWGAEQYVCHSTYEGPGSSCATSGVLGANLLVLLAGLALWRWRPGRRRA